MSVLQQLPLPSRRQLLHPPAPPSPPPPHSSFPKPLTNRTTPLHTPLSCSISSTATTTTTTEPDSNPTEPPAPPRVLKKMKRYRKAYPGEATGITEELRFVAMRLLRNDKDKVFIDRKGEGSEGGRGGLGIWEPSVEGFVRYLVDSMLVFNTIERVVSESDDVSYAYFRNTGLERSSSIATDLQWFREKDILIPEPGKAGRSYAEYLDRLAQKSVPSFLSHLYTIHFSHLSGGQVIIKQVSEKLFDGRELEVNRWDDDPQILLKDVRDNFNKLAEPWSRGDKNRCLKESAKSYKFLGQIVQLIVSI